jgi:hypothetical protein
MNDDGELYDATEFILTVLHAFSTFTQAEATVAISFRSRDRPNRSFYSVITAPFPPDRRPARQAGEHC